jgi:hypothetical protein
VDSVLLGAAALACPVSMGLMMWFMAKGMGREKEPREEHRRRGELDD